jgi:LuxR family maltose regulon positive regulatory protein
MRTTIPRTLRPLVRRARATALLHDWHQRRIIGVVAPAGFGKTTLIGEWLRSLPTASPEADATRVTWCGINASDDAPDALLPRLLDIVGHADAAALAAVLRAGEMSAEKALELALAELGSQPGPHIVVFDDFHLLHNPDVHRLVQSIVDAAPANLHLVLLSRTPLPLALSRQRLSGELVEISQSDLAFDHDEFLAFVHAGSLAGCPSEQLQDIERRCAGWIAGLQMFVLAGARGAPAAAEALFLPDFLLHEVLRHQPADLADILVRTSVLPQLDAAGLRAVLDVPVSDAADIVQRLLRAELLIQSLAASGAEGGVAVRLHPLLREFLLRQLAERFPPDEVLRLRQRAADALAAAGDVDAALALYSDDSDDDFAAARLLAAHSRAALLRFDVVALRRWFKRLSPAALQSQPQLALDAAWLATFTHSPDTLARQKEAAAAVRSFPADAPAPPNVRTEWHAEMSVLEFLVSREEYDEAESLGLYVRAAAAPRSPDGLAEAYLSNITAHVTGIEISVSERTAAFERSVAVSRRLGFTHLALESLLTRALLFWQNLDLARALLTCDEAIAVAELDHWQLSHLTAIALCVRADALYYLDRIDEARAAYRRTADIAARIHPAAPVDYWVHVGRTLCDLASHAPHAAPDDAEDERLFAADGRRLHPGFFSRSIWLRIQRDMRLGRIDRLDATAAHLPMSPADVVPGTRDTLGLAVFAHAIFTDRADAAALPALGTFCAHLDDFGHSWFALHARILQVLLLDRLGRRDEARPLLRRILADAERSRGIRFLLDYPQLAPLLVEENTLFAQSLRSRMPSPDGSRPHPFGLSDREVEILRLLVAGREKKKIASALAISIGTLNVHTNNLYRKLGVHSRAEAVRAARVMGIGAEGDSDSG